MTARNGIIKFNGFLFPVLSTLIYSLDGPDRKNPDCLFISDGNDNFVISFEKESCRLMDCPVKDYVEKKVDYGDRFLTIFYPDEKRNDLSMAYFAIDFNDKRCCGQINLKKREEDFSEQLSKTKILYEFAEGIEPEADV